MNKKTKQQTLHPQLSVLHRQLDFEWGYKSAFDIFHISTVAIEQLEIF
jgi:hypothetical protein